MHWRASGFLKIEDNQWSRLSLDYPDFAKLMGNITGRKDYQAWAKQHENWVLCYVNPIKEDDNTNNAAIIIGGLGDIKGAVKCSSIWPN